MSTETHNSTWFDSCFKNHKITHSQHLHTHTYRDRDIENTFWDGEQNLQKLAFNKSQKDTELAVNKQNNTPNQRQQQISNNNK